MACLAIAVYAGIRLIPGQAQAPDDTPGISDNLPSLEARFDSGSMGFEALMFYDLSESDMSNPWTPDAALTTLPVYRNLAYTDRSGTPVYLSESELLALAEEAAARLGTTITDTHYDSVSLEQHPQDTPLMGGETYRLTAVTESCTIRVSGNGAVGILFNEPQPLPAGYSFTLSDTSKADAASTIEYLLGRYSFLTGLDSPVAGTWGDYSYSGEQSRRYFAYEDADSLEQKILNYNFSQVGFSPDDDGPLSSVGYGDLLSCAEKIGDYPIITAKEATQLLLGGEYITTVDQSYLPGGVVTEDCVAKVELVYRTENTSEIFLPYYRFYVELTEQQAGQHADGLKQYGIYYVPAVSGGYLSDFPVWDGSFN